MGFTEETVKKAFQRAGGKCENKRCGKNLSFNKRGEQWHAHHKHSQASGGSDYLSNCEILCVPCHKKTYTW